MNLYIRDITQKYTTNYVEITIDKLKKLCDNALEIELEDVDVYGNLYFLIH